MFLCVSGGSRAARIASSKTFFSPRYSEEEKEENNNTVSKADGGREEQRIRAEYERRAANVWRTEGSDGKQEMTSAAMQQLF